MKSSKKSFIFLVLILVSTLIPTESVESARTRKNRKSNSQQASRNYKRSNSTRNSSQILRVKENSTNQEFIFLGCPGNEENFNDVVKVLVDAQKAWNAHNANDLLSHYAANFLTKDGLNLYKIRSNLSTFWFEYSNAKINSYPSTVQVCGNLATVNLSEITTATGQIENADVMPFPPQFKGWVQGVTTLKKIGNTWKITSEEILSEQMWKYYGPEAEKLLDDGNIELSIPLPVEEDENYIAQLNYSLPKNVQGVALVDKILLTEFPETEAEEKEREKDKKEEIESIRRSVDGRKGNGSLRRLFTANNLGQDELVRVQIELIAFKESGPSLMGIIGISQRVVPKSVPKQEDSGAIKVTKTYKEEVLGGPINAEVKENNGIVKSNG